MRLFKFAVVGVLGFVFDALFLYLLLQLSIAPMIARIMAFWLAATVTWLGNRHLTFAEQNKLNATKQWLKHMLSAHSSGLVNLSSFYLAKHFYSLELAFVLGILLGAIFNYWLSCRFVFATK